MEKLIESKTFWSHSPEDFGYHLRDPFITKVSCWKTKELLILITSNSHKKTLGIDKKLFHYQKYMTHYIGDLALFMGLYEIGKSCLVYNMKI